MSDLMNVVVRKAVTITTTNDTQATVRVLSATTHGVYVTYSDNSNGYLPWSAIISLDWE